MPLPTKRLLTPKRVTQAGNTGTIQGGVTLGQPGPLASGGTAMLFDGSTGYIKTNLTPNVTSVTAEAWINVPAYPNPAGIAIGVLDFNAGPNDMGFELYVNNVGGVVFGVGLGGSHTQAVSTGTIAVNKWVHAAGTFDAGTRSLAVYMNGTAVSMYTTPTAMMPPTKPVYISRYPLSAIDYYYGLLAHVAIYPYALSSTRILAHYNAAQSTDPYAYPLAVLSDKPMAYWPLNDPVGSTTAHDWAQVPSSRILATQR
jgi:hypothetical protein